MQLLTKKSYYIPAKTVQIFNHREDWKAYTIQYNLEKKISNVWFFFLRDIRVPKRKAMQD